MPGYGSKASAFTKEEKTSLGYGTQSLRIGRGACLEFDACYICLQSAVNPLICRNGHLTCKECVLLSILKQKEEFKLKLAAYHRQQTEIENDCASIEAKRHKEEVSKFESMQVKILESKPAKKKSMKREDGKSVIAASKEQLYHYKETKRGSVARQINGEEESGTKQSDQYIEKRQKNSSSSDQSNIVTVDNDETVTNGDGIESLAEIESDQKALTSFWIPSLTPSAAPAMLKPPTDDILCQADKPFHKIKFKKLIKVNFETQKKSGNDKKSKKQCPGCIKTLSNNLNLKVLGDCGHVLCSTCMDQYVNKDKCCPKCSIVCKKKNIIEIMHGGTGYSGCGKQVEVKKYNHAYR